MVDINEIRQAVKEVAEEVVWERFDAIEARLGALEGADTVTEDQVEKAAQKVIGAAMKSAGIDFTGSSQLDLEDDDWESRHARKSSSERRDSFGRRVRT